MVQVVSHGEKRAERKQEIDAEHPLGRPPESLPKLSASAPNRCTDTAPVQLEVVDLRSSSARARFIDMVHPIYAGDQNFVAPLRFERMRFLNPAKNPSFENLDIRALLATLDGRVVGRMTAHVDRRYNTYHGTKTGWFGFFESIDDPRVAHALLADGIRWLESQGMTEVIGPLNFTTNHTAGLLVENFSRPAFVEMTYNPPYYERLLTSFGFGKAKDLLAWWIDVREGMQNTKVARVARIADRVRHRPGVTIRHVKLADFHAEVERLFELYNTAWQKNWGFVPLTKTEFEAIAHDLKEVVVPELLVFVEVNGKPVAFSCTLPNINECLPRDGKLFPFGWLKLLTFKKRVKNARLFTLGVVPEYRKQGLETLLFVETVLRANRLGYHSGEIGWTLEDNALINRAIEAMDGRLDRRYRLLGLDLT